MYLGKKKIQDNKRTPFANSLCRDNHKLQARIIIFGLIYLFYKKWSCPWLINIGTFNIEIQRLCEFQWKQFQFDLFAICLTEKKKMQFTSLSIIKGKLNSYLKRWSLSEFRNYVY